jgi:hypothetical protein
LIGQEIARDLPDFTVHDVTHLDALWEMAELTAGRVDHLTPTEAFVLGGAFLIHDLGMGLAAYPEGKVALRGDKSWPDTIAAILRRKLGRAPKPNEITSPSVEVEKEAIGETLRALHARHAARLALTTWQDPKSGTAYHLIENPELRERYGSIIGQIAYSHWWSVPELKERFTSTLGAPGGWPSKWTVDPLKLACMLRVADATHIDSRRAPAFLRALRKPHGTGDDHWAFQQKLGTPEVRDERIFYTAGSPFRLDEAPAWWLCRDVLEMIDGELRHVDALLADTGRPRLAVRSVAGIDDPSRLTSFIPTEGWKPVDTRVRITDVPALVQRLGGEQLYGEDPVVPLRELIQNASDAVRARRLLEGRPDSWGEIIVRLGSDASGHWLEVEDTGIGMSAGVVTGPLLDFGNTYWGSSLMRYESPGLWAKGFTPTGRYGIGFFSVFMWGQRVRVSTRRPEEALGDTRVLEFSTGLAARPILRAAMEEEYIRDGGTRVRVWLKTEPKHAGGLLWREAEDSWSLARLCAWLCPALDVNLSVEEKGRRKRVIKASDWLVMPGADLLRRIYEPKLVARDGVDEFKSRIAIYGSTLRVLGSGNGPAGRACVLLDQFDDYLGVVTVGGLRAGHMSGIGGVLVGESTTATRDYARPMVQAGTLAQWSSEQARLLAQARNASEEALCEAAAVVCACGGDTSPLPIARTRLRWVSCEDIANSWSGSKEALLLQDALLYSLEGQSGVNRLQLHDNVIVVNVVGRAVLHSGYREGIPQGYWPSSSTRSLRSVVIEALEQNWSASFGGVPRRAVVAPGEREIGTIMGKPVRCNVDVVLSPSNVRQSPKGAVSKSKRPIKSRHASRPRQRDASLRKPGR